MKIDVTSPNGNTVAALSIATRILRQVGADKEEIDALTREVMTAKSVEEARMLITTATNGAIEFFVPDEDED